MGDITALPGSENEKWGRGIDSLFCVQFATLYFAFNKFPHCLLDNPFVQRQWRYPIIYFFLSRARSRVDCRVKGYTKARKTPTINKNANSVNGCLHIIELTLAEMIPCWYSVVQFSCSAKLNCAAFVLDAETYNYMHLCSSISQTPRCIDAGFVVIGCEHRAWSDGSHQISRLARDPPGFGFIWLPSQCYSCRVLRLISSLHFCVKAGRHEQTCTLSSYLEKVNCFLSGGRRPRP